MSIWPMARSPCKSSGPEIACSDHYGSASGLSTAQLFITLPISPDISEHIAQLNAALGVPSNYATSRGLALCLTPEELVETEPDFYGRPQRLTAQALQAWSQMKSCAAESEITLHLISAFRSPDYQYELLKRKLDAGQSIDQILQVNAAPGYSEHHTGRAIDVGTLGCAALVEEFEWTPAFAWLREHAGEFGFALSYPRDNPSGMAYEPWHWCFREQSSGAFAKNLDKPTRKE